MTTTKFKEKLRQHIRRPIGLDELEAIAIEKGKVKPKHVRTGGGTSFTWDESEIPEVINQLNS